LKRLHLKEVLPPGNKIEELPDDTSSRTAAVPSSPPRCTTPPPQAPGGSLSTAISAAFQSVASVASPLQSKMSTVAPDDEECGSEYPASSVRIRLGILEFVSTSVGTSGMFDSVSFLATIQLGSEQSAPPARWLDNGPHTEKRVLKYGRSIDEKGRYEAKIGCHFEEALDLPWPPPAPVPDKIFVDIYIETTTVADHFDRVLGNLGLHTPAGIDRRWIGRAVADLPPEGVDDMPFAWAFEQLNLAAVKCPVPQTMSIGVEWVYEQLAATSELQTI